MAKWTRTNNDDAIRLWQLANTAEFVLGTKPEELSESDKHKILDSLGAEYHEVRRALLKALNPEAITP